MLQVQATAPSAPPLDRDLDLSLLASKAAIELDDLLLGRASGMQSVSTLADILARMGGPDTAESPLTTRVDPYAALVVGGALSHSEWATPVTTVAELAREAGAVAARLHDSSTGMTGPDWIERMRSFCLALSKAAAAYGDSLKALRPRRPFGT